MSAAAGVSGGTKPGLQGGSGLFIRALEPAGSCSMGVVGVALFLLWRPLISPDPVIQYDAVSGRERRA